MATGWFQRDGRNMSAGLWPGVSPRMWDFSNLGARAPDEARE